MAFNPFGKEIGQTLSTDDLQTLLIAGVAEGYVVEYKGDFPSNTKISHSIASFANTYGGWYIVGVTTDENNIATGIPGFDSIIHLDSVSKIREITKSNIDPTPIFYPQVVPLDSHRSVLIVYVPGEQDAPFITRDGRIYRRVHDSSDPVKEENRSAVDRMYESSRERARRFRDFCEDERTFSQAEADNAWVSVFLAPYPGGLNMTHSVGRNSQSLEEILTLSRTELSILPGPTPSITGSIPFDVAYPTNESVVLVHRFQSALAFNVLTVEFFSNGRAKIHIPVSYIPSYAPNEALDSKSAVAVIEEAVIRDRDSSSLVRFFNGGLLLVQLASLMTLYCRWIGTQPLLNRLEYACNLTGMWRHVAVLDADAWGEFSARFGLPILAGDATIRQASGRGYFANWIGEDTESIPWIDVASDVFLALGVPTDVFARSVRPAFMRASAASKQPTNRESADRVSGIGDHSAV